MVFQRDYYLYSLFSEEEKYHFLAKVVEEHRNLDLLITKAKTKLMVVDSANTFIRTNNKLTDFIKQTMNDFIKLVVKGSCENKDLHDKRHHQQNVKDME